MALHPCPDCGHEVSDHAVACPHCGRPQSASAPATPALTPAPKQKTGCLTWLVVGLLAMVFIGALGSMQGHERAPGVDPAQARRDADLLLRGRAQLTIRAALRDPESAVFRDVVVVHHDTMTTVCGSVNAKNGFGGFTGYTDFMAWGERVMVESSENADVFVPRWNRRCAAPRGPAPRITR